MNDERGGNVESDPTMLIPAGVGSLTNKWFSQQEIVDIQQESSHQRANGQSLVMPEEEMNDK